MAKSEKKEKPQLCAAVLFNMLCQMKRDADDEGIEITDPRVMGIISTYRNSMMYSTFK